MSRRAFRVTKTSDGDWQIIDSKTKNAVMGLDQGTCWDTRRDAQQALEEMAAALWVELTALRKPQTEDLPSNVIPLRRTSR